MAERHVVTSIVRNRGRILLLRRSSEVGSYRGQWAGVSGYIECDEPDENAARREMAEEVGIESARLVKHIPLEMFRDMDIVWCVHPFLFETKDAKIRIDWEHESYKWVSPKDIAAYPTVPGLQQIISKLLM
ncbi:MAG: NUDIX domain-containing protein [Thermoplasmata archaeon]